MDFRTERVGAFTAVDKDGNQVDIQIDRKIEELTVDRGEVYAFVVETVLTTPEGNLVIYLGPGGYRVCPPIRDSLGGVDFEPLLVSSNDPLAP